MGRLGPEEREKRNREMLALLEDGFSCIEVGQRYGMARQSVGLICKALGWVPSDYSRYKGERNRRIYLEACSGKKTQAQIAREHGISRQRVHGIVIVEAGRERIKRRR